MAMASALLCWQTNQHNGLFCKQQGLSSECSILER